MPARWLGNVLTATALMAAMAGAEPTPPRIRGATMAPTARLLAGTGMFIRRTGPYSSAAWTRSIHE
ncbi:hypothetical protein GCM10010306_091520 [Streptomyces umbrinus]|nr:hypothetical protein GCM10010306_091520 [Streptomyces umbrinus]